MEHTEITFEKVLERMRHNELREKVLNMGFREQEVERYFTNSQELIEVVKKY